MAESRDRCAGDAAAWSRAVPEPTEAHGEPQRQPFGVRLQRAMREHGPLCVGVDPHPELLDAWGLPRTAAGLERFSLSVVAAAAGHAATVKPQVALYEAYGSAGIAVLERVLREAREVGVLTIADAKRGDIGSTMAAYATAWLSDDSPLAADSVTLSPYLGFESLRPAVDLAHRTGRGVFVLGLTSNPEGAAVQHVGGAASVAKSIITSVHRENLSGDQGASLPAGGDPARNTTSTLLGDNRDQIVIKPVSSILGSCGVVVGATVGRALEQLQIDLRGFSGPVLSPGFGAQGADAAAVASVFAHVRSNVLANSSRGVLRHGPDMRAMKRAIRDSAAELRDALHP